MTSVEGTVAPRWRRARGWRFAIKLSHWRKRYSGRILRFLNVFVSDVLPLSLQNARKIRGVREERAGPKVTYALIPGVPESVESLVETNGEGEGADKDAGDKDACEGNVNFTESGQGWCWQTRTVSSSERVVERSSELEAKSRSPRRHRRSKSMLTAILSWRRRRGVGCCRKSRPAAWTAMIIMNSTLLRSSISSIRTLPHTPRLFTGLATPAPYDGPPLPPSKSPSSLPPPVNPYSWEVQKKGSLDTNVHHLHVYSTRNNTITTFTTQEGNPIAWWSGGSCGFKKNNRSSYEAGYQCTIRAFEKIRDYRNDVGPFSLEIIFKGFGQGREAMQKALLASEGEQIRPLVVRLTDHTPVKIGGTRAKKARRL